MGGGNILYCIAYLSLTGLSPRGRGKPKPMPLAEVSDRSIPAWAGETITAQAQVHGKPVYPRVGGGNI